MSEYALQYTGEKINELLSAVDKNGSAWALPKVLWKGSWSSGSITVKEIRNYSLVAIVFDDQISAICWVSDSSINGGSCWISSGGDPCTSHIKLSVSGNVLTIKYNRHVVLYSGSEVPAESLAITKIIGIF